MAEKPPRASVIIPNWNGLALLRPCLEALSRQTYRNREIIVVDNGSDDGSVEAVQRDFAWVHVLAEDLNHGYAAGCNLGMAAADGDILVLLNNDTVPQPTWLQELVEALLRHPEAGSATSRLMVYGRPGILHSAGDIYRVDGTADSRGVWQTFGPPYDREGYVFGGNGAAVAYRREVIERLGGFEPGFFMWCEDVDLSWRAQLAGHRCVYAPRAVVRHHITGSGSGPTASFFVGRNTIWVIARCYPWSLLRRYWRKVVRAQARIAREALRSWRGRAARARLKGQVVGLLTWPRWIPARLRIQGQRTVGIEYILELLDGE